MTHPDCKGWHDQQPILGPLWLVEEKDGEGDEDLAHSKSFEGHAAGWDRAASASAVHADAPICSVPNSATSASHSSSLTSVL